MLCMIPHRLNRLNRAVSSVRPHLWAAAGLVALVAVLYWPAIGFGFVNWDDPWYVVNNPLIRSWHPSNLYGIATQIVTRNYAPATIFSFLLDHTLWGLWPGGYHLSNIVLHSLNAILVYALMRQFTQSRFTAWATAALFAVHPVQIETVAWVSSRKGLLSGTFILASLICWLRPQRTAGDEAWGLLWFVLALLSKALAVVVPAIVLLYDVLVRRHPLSVAVPRQVIPGFLALLLLFATMSAQTTQMGGVRDHFTLNKAEILAVDTVILWRYVGMLIWPADLCVLYDPPTTGIAPWVALATLGWLGVAVGVFFCRRRAPLIPFAVCTFGVLLLPVLNLFPITTLMNDRYLYLPCIPMLGLTTTGVFWSAERIRRRLAAVPTEDGKTAAQHLRHVMRMSLPAFDHEIRLKSEFYPPTHVDGSPTWRCAMNGLAGITVLCGIVFYGQMTRAHLPVWRSGLTLWTHTARHVPQMAVVQIQLANTLEAAGRTEEAVAVLEEALAQGTADALDRQRIQEKLSNWRN